MEAMSELYARIREGAPIFHDFGCFKWPMCRAPRQQRVASNPNMVFRVKVTGAEAACSALHYGLRFGEGYGCGSILLKAEHVIKPVMRCDRGGTWFIGWPGDRLCCTGDTAEKAWSNFKAVQEALVRNEQ